MARPAGRCSCRPAGSANALHPDWWQNPAIGGGQLVEQAIHIYDLARYFLGDVEPSRPSPTSSPTAFPQLPGRRQRAPRLASATARIGSICSSNTAEPGVWGSEGNDPLRERDGGTAGPRPGDLHLPRREGGRRGGGRQAELRRETLVNATNPTDEVNRNFIAAIREGRAASLEHRRWNQGLAPRAGRRPLCSQRRGPGIAVAQIDLRTPRDGGRA